MCHLRPPAPARYACRDRTAGRQALGRPSEAGHGPEIPLRAPSTTVLYLDLESAPVLVPLIPPGRFHNLSIRRWASPAVFELLDHTADVGVRARGRTLEEAFAETARGMAAIMADTTGCVPSVERHVEVEGHDLE
ncbi:MAG TPA: archease, partial [Thermoplasmata archaeon]|nr:archease [Thermoplasmata archaeon]